MQIINFFIMFFIKSGIYLSIMYLTGLLVVKKGVKVNYTRKINHFALLVIPFLLDMIMRPPESLKTDGANYLLQAIGLLSGLLFFLLFIEPVRKRVGFLRTAFASLDRPEDRPYTLLWMVTQTTANFLVAIPIGIYLDTIGKQSLIFILFIINGIGDGLAEPIGIRFGKHKYTTRALFTQRKFVRSIEGSAVVFIISLLAVTVSYSLFTPIQFVFTIIILPIAMTLAEAFAPHSWDNPFLFGIGSIILFLILQFI